MIENEIQYHVTMTQLLRFKESLDHLVPTGDAIVDRAGRESIESMIETLAGEVRAWEQSKEEKGTFVMKVEYCPRGEGRSEEMGFLVSANVSAFPAPQWVRDTDAIGCWAAYFWKAWREDNWV